MKKPALTIIILVIIAVILGVLVYLQNPQTNNQSDRQKIDTKTMEPPANTSGDVTTSVKIKEN